MRETVGKLVKTLRKNCYLTQEQLGEKIGYTREQISKIENGRVDPSREILAKMSDIFNFDIMSIVHIFDKFSSIEAYNGFKDLRCEIENRNLAEIKRISNEIRTLSDFSSGEPKQLILYADALIMTYVNKNYMKSIDLCREALNLIYDGNYQVAIETSYLTDTSYSLLFLLAANYEFISDNDSLKQVTESTLKNIESRVFNYELPLKKDTYFMKKCYIVALNNVAHYYHLLGDYSASLQYVEIGITKSNSYNILIILPFLLQLKFENLYLQGNYYESQKNFEMFSIICRITKNDDLLDDNIESFKKRYYKLVFN